MEQETVTDLYEASWLLLNGCRLEGIDCVSVPGSIACRMVFQGKNLQELCQAYHAKKVNVDLWAFRGAYNELQSCLRQAKKSWAISRRQKEARP